MNKIILYHIRKLITGSIKIEGVKTGIFKYQTSSFIKAQYLVNIFYALSIFIVFKDIGLINKFSDINNLEFLWPVAWVKYFHISGSFNFIYIILLASSILCALNPNNRFLRIVFFLSFLEFLAFKFSLGKINHSSHSWLFASFIFIFLPRTNRNNKTSITGKQNYLSVVWCCILFVLLFYSLAGFWKVYAGIGQIIKGQHSIISFDVFAIQIANRLLQNNSTSLLGEFFIKNHFIGWLSYMFSIYIELFSIVVAFRPSLHRIWGIMLITFHIGTKLTMNIGFNQQIMYDALFLVCSPFLRTNVGIKNIVLDLPLISMILKLLNKVLKRINDTKYQKQ